VIRVVLAVLLAAALMGASFPAVDSARETAAADAAERNADTLTDAARSIVADSDPSAPGVPGARTTVRVGFPEASFANAGLDYLAVGGHPNRTLERDTPESDVLVYKVPGRPPRIRPLPYDVRAGPAANDSTPLLLRGDTELRLGYVRTDAGPAVTVSRADV
jgi:hypothetical protein